MKPWTTCALLAGMAALACAPVVAQRGGMVSGGHAAPAGRGGFSTRGGFSGGARPTASFTAPRFISSPGQIATSAVAPARAYSQYGRQGAYGYSRRGYANRVRGYGYYPLAVYPGYLNWGYDDFLDYPDFSGDGPADQAESAPPSPPQAVPPDQDAYAVPAAPGQAEFREAVPGPYAPRYTPAAPAPAPLPEEDAVTIVFRDGRPSEQIRNYALTRTALFVPGRRIREIPLDQIDLPATVKVNREAGVTFQVPQAQ